MKSDWLIKIKYVYVYIYIYIYIYIHTICTKISISSELMKTIENKYKISILFKIKHY